MTHMMAAVVLDSFVSDCPNDSIKNLGHTLAMLNKSQTFIET
jgi:hypothetical protein